MFSRWGAFVYRFRRPVALIAIVIALASTDPRDARPRRPVGGRLARRQLRIGRGRPPASTPSSGPARARSSRSSAPTTPGADATSAEFQGAIATSTAGPGRRPAGDRHHRLRRDRRHALHQHGRRRRLHRHRARRDRRGSRSTSSTTIRAGDRAAGRLHLPADRLRPDHQGLRRAVREGPPEGRARLAADRRARPRSSSSPRSSRPACRCSSPASPSRAAWRSSTSSPSRSR